MLKIIWTGGLAGLATLVSRQALFNCFHSRSAKCSLAWSKKVAMIRAVGLHDDFLARDEAREGCDGEEMV
jgi:hypothetical protein